MRFAAMDGKLSQGMARAPSGAMRKNSAVLPNVSKPKLPRAPARSPSQSLSDTSDGESIAVRSSVHTAVPDWPSL